MTLQFEIWHMVLVLMAFFSACAATAKFFFDQLDKSLEKQFQAQGTRLDSMDKSLAEETKEWQRVERDLNNMKADLPVLYVRREDYIRGQSVIEVKLDSISHKFENVQLRSMLNAQNKGNSP